MEIQWQTKQQSPSQTPSSQRSMGFFPKRFVMPAVTHQMTISEPHTMQPMINTTGLFSLLGFLSLLVLVWCRKTVPGKHWFPITDEITPLGILLAVTKLKNAKACETGLSSSFFPVLFPFFTYFFLLLSFDFPLTFLLLSFFFFKTFFCSINWLTVYNI